ncbi:MAG TPA: hypothetical protein VGP04_08925, partial [Pseudonocardiaceae bacterium]|nr:hypothetical protein [Pseudonocardiaceae bacterium]
MKARILAVRSRTERYLPRWMAWRSMIGEPDLDQVHPGRVRLYNPTTGRFLQTDPVAGGNAN